MRMKGRLTALAATVATMGLAHSAKASYVTFQTPQTISGVSDVSTAGSFVLAYGFGNPSTSYTVNGVTFSSFGSGTSNTDASITIFTAPFQGASTGLTKTLNGDTSGFYKDLLNGINYSNSSNAATLTLSGLISTDTYQVELWYNESSQTKTETVSGDAGGGTSQVISLDTGAANGYAGEYVIGTFTASGTSQVINFASGGSGTDLNAVLLSNLSVPEPISLGFLAIGGAALLLRRRSC